MDKKIIGSVAAIGTLAYLYSTDVFKSATFSAEIDSNCVKGNYNTLPAKYKHGMKWSKITPDMSKNQSNTPESERWYNVIQFKHRTTGSKPAGDDKISVMSVQGIQKAMKYAHKWKSGNNIFIHDATGDYCKSLAETVEGEKPSNGDDEGTVAAGGAAVTDWCAVKANSPRHIKAIPSQIKSEIAKATKKVEKEGAEELARLKSRYEKAKKECSAKEEVQKKLKDTDIGEGFWEKLLAYLNA